MPKLLYRYVSVILTCLYIILIDAELKVTPHHVSKQFLIHRLPPVLILRMKRFKNIGETFTKDNQHISFPLILNMAPFCTRECVKVTVIRLHIV